MSAPFRQISAPVRLEWQHRLYFTRDIFAADNPTLLHALSENGGEKPRVAIFVDEGVIAANPGLSSRMESWAGVHAASLEFLAPPHPVPGGEPGKNDPRTFENLLSCIRDARLCRHSVLVAVGGGAMLDVTGFAAATAHRGIPLIRVPTTSLSQADSGVGVKNAVNHFGRKNWLGAFAVPRAVVNDSVFLETLSRRERRAGLVEAVKVALIRDGGFYQWLEDRADALAACEPPVLHQAIERSAGLHFEHITRNGDPFEQGSSRPLDFGHWAAHKLEQLTGFQLGHAEAVAVGMALDLEYAAAVGMLAEEDAQRFIALLTRLGFAIHHPQLLEDALLDGLEEFREHLGGVLTIPLVVAAGRKTDVHTMDAAAIRRSIARLRERAR